MLLCLADGCCSDYVTPSGLLFLHSGLRLKLETDQNLSVNPLVKELLKDLF